MRAVGEEVSPARASRVRAAKSKRCFLLALQRPLVVGPLEAEALSWSRPSGLRGGGGSESVHLTVIITKAADLHQASCASKADGSVCASGFDVVPLTKSLLHLGSVCIGDVARRGGVVPV